MGIAPTLSPDEPLRLQSLRELHIVDTPLEERFERITRLAQRTLNVRSATISLVEADRQWFKSSQGCDICETPRDISFCGHAILESDLLVVEDARKDPRFFDNPLVVGPPYVVFYAGCPVRSVDGYALGMLCVVDSSPRTFSRDDRRTLIDLAALVETELRAASASAMQAALIEDASAETRRSMIDSLTRVWNRDGIMAVVEQALSHTSGSKDGTAFVMVDLDRFKQINDTHGHPVGDGVLRTFAKRVLGSLRESDVIGRLGGDEFLLVLHPCKSSEGALGVVQRVHDRLTADPLSVFDLIIPATASFGLFFAKGGSSWSADDVIARADKALYDAKHQGRNRISHRRKKNIQA